MHFVKRLVDFYSVLPAILITLLLLSCHGKTAKPISRETELVDKVTVEVVRGEFHSRRQERATLTLMLDDTDRLYGEISRYGFPLAQFSFDGLNFAFRNNDNGVLTCEKNNEFTYFYNLYGIKLKPKELSNIIKKNETSQQADYVVLWRGKKDFAIGSRADLMIIKVPSGEEFFWRITDWQQRHKIAVSSFKIGDCR